jgi:tetratricopeptide (TPR) repeat protein
MSFLRKYPILFFFFISLAAHAQNQLSSQFDYANNLFKANQFFDAVTEYKRLLFFDSKNEYVFPANYKIGEAYKAGLKFDEAVKYFSLAEMAAGNSEQKYSAEIEIVKTNILRRTTDRAHQLLDEMEKTFYTGVYKDSLNYWRGWTYIFADDWQKASGYFAKINPSHELKLLCDNVEKEKVSVTFTKVISYILPGAGQIYTGQYFSGIMSLGYNVLFGYLTINSFTEERIFDGFAVGSLLWLRFYRGNVQNAEKFAEEKNIETANKALRYLQNNYQGQKP